MNTQINGILLDIEMGDLLIVALIIFIVLILFFLIARELICWYYKINARLKEQEKTNELLQDIYDAIVQGTMVNSVTAGHIVNAEQNSFSSKTQVLPNDIPEL